MCAAVTSSIHLVPASRPLVTSVAARSHRVCTGLTIVALLGLIYSLAMFVGAGLEATLWGLGLALVGLPIRYLSRRFNSPETTPQAAPAQAAPRE